ncbi:MAG: thioredoxin domain-containing protein [Candidatus Omnitrophota bacterium]
MLKMVEVNDSQFDTLVLKSALPVLVECASPECIICKSMAQRIYEAGKSYASKMIFFRLNVNDNTKQQEFNVRVIPTLLYFKDGVLVARQDDFPEVEEIIAQIKIMTRRDSKSLSIYKEFKAVIDLEYAAAKFSKYVTTNAKNGKVKEKFRLMHQESLVHKKLLIANLQELTGEAYAPGLSHAFDGLQMKPQGFSLIGALKMAIKIEEKLVPLYNRLKKDKLVLDKNLFKKLAKEAALRLKELAKEIKFVQEEELFSSLESPHCSKWLNKVFK